jgi:hypothetical protein
MVEFNKPKHLNFEPYFEDPPAVQSNESMSDIVRGLTQTLPEYMRVQNQQVLPQSQTQLEAAKVISPQYAALMNELYQLYAPELAKAGANVENINRTAAAKTDLDILRGSGGELAREAQNIDRTLNPEVYKTKASAADKLGQLLASINLDDANPEAERLVSQENVRTGNQGNTSATNTVSNALSFGGELDKRRASLSNAINTATNFLQPAQGSFNPIQTALGRPSTNTGSNQFTGISNPGSQAYQSGAQLLGSSTALKQQQNDINANRRDALDRFNETLTSVGSIVSV